MTTELYRVTTEGSFTLLATSSALAIGLLGAPAIIGQLVGVLCALIALYFIVVFLLSLI